MRIGRLDNAKTCATQRRVNPKDNPLRDVSGSRWGKNGQNLVCFAADALFHCFELAKGNAHTRILPVADKLQKQKRFDESMSMILSGRYGMSWCGR